MRVIRSRVAVSATRVRYPRHNRPATCDLGRCKAAASAVEPAVEEFKLDWIDCISKISTSQQEPRDPSDSAVQTTPHFISLQNNACFVVLVPSHEIVDTAKLAQLLDTSGRDISVSPLSSGHGLHNFAHPLPPDGVPVIVDSKLLCYSLLYLGPESSPGALSTPTEALLLNSGTFVSDVSTSNFVSKESPATSKQVEQHPVAWPPGAKVCKLRACVVNRHRVNKQLVLVDLAPISAVLEARGGTPSRLSWSDPETGQSCRVQMTMGASMRTSGAQTSVTKAMREVKAGCVVDCVGWPTASPESAATSASTSSSSPTSPAPPAPSAPGSAVEFVAATVSVVPTSERAWSSRGGAVKPRLLRELARPQGALSAAVYKQREAASAEPQAAPALKRGAGKQRLRRDRRQWRKDEDLGFEIYKCPLQRSDIVQVTDAAGVRAALSDLLASAREADLSRSGSYWKVTPVGMDAEWQPYVTREAPTPVATLQIATRRRAWLFDMQALCRSVRNNSKKWLSSEGRYDPNTPWPASDPELRELTDSEAATSDFLEALFACPGLLKLGFSFENDLLALVASFPHLPVFAALPVRLPGAMAAWRRTQPSRRRQKKLLAVRGTAVKQTMGRRRMGRRPPASSAVGAGLGSSGGGGDGSEALPSTQAATEDGVGGAEKAKEVVSGKKWDWGSSEDGCDRIGSFELRSFVNMRSLEVLCGHREQEDPRPESLNNLTKRMFNQALDKTAQMSSWASRPLKESQVVYAANDAHILVVIADKMMAEAEAEPNMGAVWDTDGGKRLLRTMYPKNGDRDCFVFGSGAGAEEVWEEWWSGDT